MPIDPPLLIKLLGWTGQGLFFSRGLVQWLQSEKAGKSVSTPAFWWFSLAGTLLVGFYSAYVSQPILLFVFAINAGIYGRNLILCSKRFGHVRLSPLFTSGVTLSMALILWLSGTLTPKHADQAGPLWLTVGTLGLVLWSSRFPYQWWASERRGHSHFDATFWWLSLAGNVPMLAYALHIGDPLFIASFALGPLTQIRNLMLLKRAAGQIGTEGPSEDPLAPVVIPAQPRQATTKDPRGRHPNHTRG